MENHNVQLKDLSESATNTSNSVVKLEEKVKQLSNKVEQLSEKCIDLEGRSKRNNIRLAGVPEGRENGQHVRDFVAKLLRDLLDLDETPLLDRAHRALRATPEDEATTLDCKDTLLPHHGRNTTKTFYQKESG